MGRSVHQCALWGALVAATACEPTQGQVFQHLGPSGEVPAPAGAGASSSEAGGAAVEPTLPSEPPNPPTAMETDPPVTPEPGLDPNLRFEWKQSLPGQGTCKAGLYVGSFECTVAGPFGPVRIEGQMTFTLVGSDEAQVLELSDGMLSDFTGEWFTSALEGSVTCVDKRVSVRTVDGRAKPMPAGLPPEWWAILPELGTFEALFGASYDDQLLFMEGGMAMFNSLGETCTGTWRAGFVP